MATITGLTAARMLEIENASVVDGDVVGGSLILTRFDGSTINAGTVTGATGATGAQGPAGPAGVASIPGEVKLWPGGTLPVQATYGKWVWADGAVYAVATYPIANGHINAAWRTFGGASDPGGSNFRVPDLRGLVPVGLDAMPGGTRANRMTRSVAITLAGRAGEETHIITIPEMPAHAHGVNDPGHDHNMGWNAFSGDKSGGIANVDDSTEDRPSLIKSSVTNISIQNNGGGGAHENVQPSVFVPYIVRLDG